MSSKDQITTAVDFSTHLFVWSRSHHNNIITDLKQEKQTLKAQR